MNKVILYIKPITIINDAQVEGDFQQVDLFEDETISVTSKIQDIRDISKVFTDFSQSFTLPASKKNNKIFKHFYNYYISEGSFDARKKVEAVLEINYIPFRRGKVFLNGVKMKNNKPYAYNITFFGNTVSLNDLFGDDELSQLDLSSFNHEYSTSNVRSGLISGLFSQSIIYPLITHTKRLYFNSNTSHNQNTISGDLHYQSNNSHNRDVALQASDLKPAIKAKDIISAIETKYGIDFVDSDFISTTPMDNLYLWLSRRKGAIGGESGQEQIKILEDWTVSNAHPFLTVSSNGKELYRPSNISFGAQTAATCSAKFAVTITPLAAYTNVPYTIQILRSGVVVAEQTGNLGTATETIVYFQSVNATTKTGSPHTFRVITNDSFEFTPEIVFTVSGFSNSGSETWVTSPSVQNVVSTIIITDQIPKMKVIDFVSGILKMFNLTVYYIDNENDSDYGKIRMIPLDDFYDDNPKIFDITKYVDSSEHDIESTVPFTEIDFEYEKPKTLLMKQHEQVFNHIFGDEEFKLETVDRGKPYKIKVPFEHFKYERLIDEATDNLTSLQWGYSASDNFKPDADAQPQPTANYESVLTKPLLFYGIRITGLTTGNGINFYGATHEELSSYFKPSNTNETSYTEDEPRYTGTNTTSTAFRVASTALGAGAKVGDFMLNTTDNVLTTVTSIIDFNTVGIADDVFDLGDGFKTYRKAEYTLNFDNEVDEWALTDYNGDTNSLFKNFYQTYIEDAFNAKKRIFKLTAHLPSSVLLNYKLNDRFQIGDKVFTINSIDTNLKTGESKLELLNVLW